MNEINLYFLGLDLKFCIFYILEINVFGYLDFFKNKICFVNCCKIFYIWLNLIKESMIVILWDVLNCVVFIIVKFLGNFVGFIL